jgi:HemY protein
VTRFLILLLIFLALGAAVAFYLRADSGYVLVSYGPWILETSLLGFIAATVLVLLLGVYGLRLIVTVVRLPELFRGALAARRERVARASFEAGLEKMLEGQWKRAEVELVRRAADHHAARLNYLFAARAAQRAGMDDRREHYLQLAEQSGETARLPAALVRAELMLERDEPVAALKLLETLHRADPKHPHVIELLAEAQSRAGDWESLRRLLSGVERLRALRPAYYERLMSQALTGLLDAASATARLDALKTAWDGAPAAFRQKPALRRRYLEGLAPLGGDSEAAALIEKTLRQEWDGALVALYGRLEGIDQLTQLATVEQWLGRFGEEPELLRTAGRVCMRNRLWGKARSYLEGSIRRDPTPEAYLLLAQLCEATKNADEAAKFHKLGLELVAK